MKAPLVKVPLVRIPSARRELIVALPRGRILDELRPLLERAGLEPEPAFDDPASRQLRFTSNEPGVTLIRVRSFDVATLVAHGAAQLGIVGNDVIMEQRLPGFYTPLNLGIGRCRMVVAAPAGSSEILSRWSTLRVATKYPQIAGEYLARHNIQAECITLGGAIELAPSLGLCSCIVDLVGSGRTLAANGLAEIDEVMAVSARLIVHRAALKTRPAFLQEWIGRFRKVSDGSNIERS